MLALYWLPYTGCTLAVVIWEDLAAGFVGCGIGAIVGFTVLLATDFGASLAGTVGPDSCFTPSQFWPQVGQV